MQTNAQAPRKKKRVLGIAEKGSGLPRVFKAIEREEAHFWLNI